jgi:hypothetical protein
MISIAEGTPDFTRAFLVRALARRVVTSTFHTPRLEVAKILGVPVSLTIGTLRDFSGVPGRFKLNFALLQEFNIKDVLVVWGWQEVDEKHEERLFCATMFSTPDVGDFVP